MNNSFGVNGINDNNSYQSQIDRLSIKLDSLEAMLTGLNLGGCKYGKADQSSSEELTERPIQADRVDIILNRFRRAMGDYPGKASEGLEASCDGDLLGQCEPGCDGVSKRGSCIEPMGLSHWIIAQCGQVATQCGRCSLAMHSRLTMGAKRIGELACKYEPVAATLSPVDNVPSSDIEDEPVYCIDYYGREYTVDKRSGKKTYITPAPVSDKSNKPRRATVDNDDTKCGVDGDSRLGGSTEPCDSEQKANMSDSGPYIKCWSCGKPVVWSDAYCSACDSYQGAAFECITTEQPMIVYCCNGAKYEARQ